MAKAVFGEKRGQEPEKVCRHPLAGDGLSLGNGRIRNGVSRVSTICRGLGTVGNRDFHRRSTESADRRNHGGMRDHFVLLPDDSREASRMAKATRRRFAVKAPSFHDSFKFDFNVRRGLEGSRRQKTRIPRRWSDWRGSLTALGGSAALSAEDQGCALLNQPLKGFKNRHMLWGEKAWT